MKVRAAVAREAGKPLSLETVDLDGPQAPARCWSKSRRPASATPMNSPFPAPIPKASSPRSWVMRAQES